jgi:hypothetical protein
MRFFVLCIILYIGLFPSIGLAHQCKLENGSAEAIMIYNSCKADLAAGITQHQSDARQPRSERELELEDENRALRQKLDTMRNSLLDVLRDLSE